MLKPSAFLLGCTLLCGCTTVGPDFERPAAPKVASYAMAGEPAPRLKLEPQSAPPQWWTAFGSDQLNALVDDALSRNQTLASADAALERARANLSVVSGGAGVQLDGKASVVRERVNTAAFGIEGFPSPTISLYSIGVGASFDFDLFGGERRRIESAEAQAQAQAARTDAAYLTLSGEVVLRAIEIAALREQIDALEEVTADSRRTVEMTRRAVEAGGLPRSAIVTARAQLAEDEARLPALRQQLAQTRHALALLTGRAPGQWSPPDIDLATIKAPAAVPLGVPSELVRRRPDILAAEARLHAATADIGVATAALYPQLRLTPDFTLAALDPSDVLNYQSSGWILGPSLTFPIFRGGQLRAQKRGAEATRNQALADYRQTVLVAFAQVADLLHAAAQDQALTEAQARASQAAGENARLANLAYQNGAGSLLSVLDAHRQAQRARLASIEAQARLRRDLAALFVASAADWRGS
ncbi:MAG: efflux transporter outer membrane subunit [Caulobacteraceae bacterium]|nr:efflux transporter outer membrane subunit [Caulobacteraceae bacterium]